MFDKIKVGEIVKAKHRVGGSMFEFIRVRDCFFDRDVPFGKGYLICERKPRLLAPWMNFAHS